MTVSPTESISPRCVRRQHSDGSNRSKSKDKDRDQRYQQMKRERDRQLEGDHNLIHEHQPGNQSNSTKDHHPNFSMAVNQGSTYNVNEVEFSSNRLEDEALSGLDTKIRCSAYTAFKTTMVDPVLEEYENERRIDVALRSDAFTYNAHNDTYTISLSNVEIIRQNELTGKLTIKLRSQQVNQEKSAPADDYLEE